MYNIMLSLQTVLLAFLLFESTNCATTCVESQKQFANLCFSPKPFFDIDQNWSETEPSDGWHVVLGNDVARLHFAEILRGQLLSLEDNFDDLCFRAKVKPANNASVGINNGYFDGFGNLTSEWNCKLSADFPGLALCDDVNLSLTEYHENFNYYTSYTDNKNFEVGIACFPNGQVGWFTHSISKILTDAEKKTIIQHIVSLGFSDDNTVSLFNENCSNE